MIYLELVPENEMFGAEKDFLLRNADMTEIVSNAGHEGFGQHNNTYRTARVSWYMTNIIEDILKENGEVNRRGSSYSVGGHERKPFDFYWKENGKDKRLKVRHIFSVLRLRKNTGLQYYEYQTGWGRRIIGEGPDIFILTGWIEKDNILYATHFWIMDAKERIKTQRTDIELKEKCTFTIYETDSGILKMKKFEDKDKLEKLMKYTIDITSFRTIKKVN